MKSYFLCLITSLAILTAGCRAFGVCANPPQCAQDEGTYSSSTSSGSNCAKSNLVTGLSTTLNSPNLTAQWISQTPAETITFGANGCTFSSNMADCAMTGTFYDSFKGGTANVILTITSPADNGGAANCLSAGGTSAGKYYCTVTVTPGTGATPPANSNLSMTCSTDSSMSLQPSKTFSGVY